MTTYPETTGVPITIRVAVEEDAAAAHRLAELDSAPKLTGRVLLAEQDGQQSRRFRLERARSPPIRSSAASRPSTC